MDTKGGSVEPWVGLTVSVSLWFGGGGSGGSGKRSLAHLARVGETFDWLAGEDDVRGVPATDHAIRKGVAVGRGVTVGRGVLVGLGVIVGFGVAVGNGVTVGLGV